MNRAGVAVGVVLSAIVLLRFWLWRALLFFRPATLRGEWDSFEADTRLPIALERLGAELSDEGFILLGSRLERAPLGPTRTLYEWANADARSFATLYVRASEPRFFFLTPLADGGFVLSANHRRPLGDESRGYLSSGLEGVTVARLHRAHQRRLVGLRPEGKFDARAREEAAQLWLDRFGRFEIRQKNVRALLWSLSALALAAYAIFSV